MESNLVVLIVALIIIIGLFIALREWNCWYWKINERIELQKEIIYLLSKGQSNEAGIENSIAGLSGKKQNTFETLTEKEILTISNLERSLNEGEKIILNKSNRKIIKITNDEWVLKYSKGNLWEIMAEEEE